MLTTVHTLIERKNRLLDQSASKRLLAGFYRHFISPITQDICTKDTSTYEYLVLRRSLLKTQIQGDFQVTPTSLSSPSEKINYYCVILNLTLVIKSPDI